MSTTIQSVFAPADTERSHRLWMRAAVLLLLATTVALAVYGLDYYRLSLAERPFSPKHALLKPGGVIGFKLGVAGFVLFLGLFAYAIRKRWPWLARRGNSKHWLDFHVLLGLAAPAAIAFHSAFKFHGIAGMAFWIMTAVAVSGLVGRYIYAQIPRRLDSAELSLKELEEVRATLTTELSAQKIIRRHDLEPLFRLPSADDARSRSLPQAALSIVASDLARPFHAARLRCRVLSFVGIMASFGGLLPSANAELEKVVLTARRQAALSKRVVFLSQIREVFHLWHVVHRPFSYSLAALATLHIAVQMLFGVFRG